jgi:hypothetical protein
MYEEAFEKPQGRKEVLDSVTEVKSSNVQRAGVLVPGSNQMEPHTRGPTGARLALHPRYGRSRTHMHGHTPMVHVAERAQRVGVTILNKDGADVVFRSAMPRKHQLLRFLLPLGFCRDSPLPLPRPCAPLA